MTGPTTPTDLDPHDQQKDADMTAQPTIQTAPPAPSGSGTTGIRIATAVIGGSIALALIGGGAISQYAIAGAASSESTHVIPASITSIDIENAVGDVSVFTTPGAEPSIDIRVDALAMNRMDAPEVEIDGNELSISVPDRDGPCFFGCWGSVTILVELGDLGLDELDVTSDVGTVAVHEGVTVRDLSIESDVGDIHVDLVAATTIDVGTDVGSVRIWAAEVTKSITVVSSVGDIEIGVQPGADYDVRASSEVGDVSNDLVGSTSATRSIVATSDVGSISVFVIR